MMNRPLKLVLSILACQAAGLLGSIFTIPAIGNWYAGLIKPALTPPNWVFGPAWTILYLLMAISLYLYSEAGGTRKGYAIFGLQLVLNILWSVLFFGLQSPLLGLAGIAALWASIAMTARVFWATDRKAGYLLLPYLAWVSFAAYLNYGVLVLL